MQLARSPNDLEIGHRHQPRSVSYTAIGTGKNNQTGVALIEVYNEQWLPAENDERPQKDGSAPGALEPTQVPYWAYSCLLGFTNRVRSQGRRTPTRQSVWNVTRTTLYT